ncbi:hypothetical protein DEO72_LG11g1352 [Vigna unguiculata]|uniref:Uncharacterized protein n=1 Tax=Vigna unguiculata TaxID=3917 RepID=A0A4D6NMW2_VIGUN|nr:hypothetical protein DEO72_LG11g1352 [Vigna unguiculata]
MRHRFVKVDEMMEVAGAVEMEVEDGVGCSVFWRQGCFRHGGGGYVDGEISGGG